MVTRVALISKVLGSRSFAWVPGNAVLPYYKMLPTYTPVSKKSFRVEQFVNIQIVQCFKITYKVSFKEQTRLKRLSVHDREIIYIL